MVIVETVFFMNLAIFNVTFFKGQMFYCITDNIPTLYQDFDLLLKTKQDCMDYGGDWVNSDQNFDNFFKSLVVVFQMSTTEGWVDVMWRVIDAAGINMIPVKDNRPFWGIFILIQIIITNFLMLNFFAGVVIESFNTERDRMGGQLLLTKSQREWVELQRFILRLNPAKRYIPSSDPTRLKLFKFYFSRKWSIIQNLVLVISSVPFALRYHRSSQSWDDLVSNLLLGSLGIFVAELIFKCVVLGREVAKSYSFFFD